MLETPVQRLTADVRGVIIQTPVLSVDEQAGLFLTLDTKSDQFHDHTFLSDGNVRIGLEDAVYLARGVLAASNAQMVVKARRIVEDLGGTIATCGQVRERLGLSVADALPLA